MKSKFVPLPGTTDLPRTPHRCVDQTTTVPVVGSFPVLKIYQALDLPATDDPQLIRTTVFRKPHKPIPVVHYILQYRPIRWLNSLLPLKYQYPSSLLDLLSQLSIRSCQVIYSQFGLAIHQNDYQAKRKFVEWAQNEIAVVPDFHKRILFSDEAHFWLNGYVNKQNCRNWSEANPQAYVETPLHPEKLTVWCALWAGEIIGPYFYKNDEGHNVTVNGDRYRAMITNFFIPELNNHDVQKLWFQQDGANRLISRFGPVNWSPGSCDLTPLDYFLWGH
ncbi:uncharacterized protein TNCV_4756061 [Trichonephila clavipes]|nr:uncharacterized protein TNCV_4756061 [Trichonephila clavipes]